MSEFIGQLYRRFVVQISFPAIAKVANTDAESEALVARSGKRGEWLAVSVRCRIRRGK